ncbi:WD repeat domain-containing protein [Diaporthe helianthi]|uniref:WD repeat domain-containing protein n=1 Tax=Diaporthe helianthi TaxID=158607 RepID=A0A2P5I343_DIAHE|nr:WD repeat domain-containing protein [Diaporthe helianthi]
MKLPFHSVQICGDILFAARGGNLHSFKLTDGSHISSWRYPLEKKGALRPEDRLVISVSDESTPNPSQDGHEGPPAKRVKLDAATSAAGENGKQSRAPSAGNGQAEVKTKETQGDQIKDTPNGKRGKAANPRPGPRSQPSERPMVMILTATPDRKYLVAVTQCKSLWVFEHDGIGNLNLVSRRIMPKRPCSVVIMPDNQTILSADKFGDVYSLPLIPSQTAAAQEQKESSPATASPSPAPAEEKPFKSQANELTVHTKRNRMALLDQQISAKSAKARGGAHKAEVPFFERTLLLGHVSLLTAVTLGHDARGRPYIITADRDEHIRVSRGTMEQAHVTEAFCMGHGEFVNRLCIADGAGAGTGDVLVSGGGDPDLFVWSWLEGRLLARAPLLSHVREVVPGAGKLAVTGLSCWVERPAEAEEQAATILVICERVPAIFLFILRPTGTLDYVRNIKLPGNPLEIEVLDGDRLIVAVEPMRHHGGEYDLCKSLLRVEHEGHDYKVTEGLVDQVTDLGEHETDLAEEELQTLLFSAENLRKTDSEEGSAEAD